MVGGDAVDGEAVAGVGASGVALGGDEDVGAVGRNVEPDGVGVGGQGGYAAHGRGVHYDYGGGSVAGGIDVASVGGEGYGAGAFVHLSRGPVSDSGGAVPHAGDGFVKALQRDALDVAGTVGAEVEMVMVNYEMAYVGLHAVDFAEISLLLQVNYGDAPRASHAAHEQVASVGGEHGAAECVSAAVVAVHGFSEAVVELEFVVDGDTVSVMPFGGIFGGYVKNSYGVFAPVGYCYKPAVGACGYHFGECAGFKEADYRVGTGVNHGHGRGVLGIDVKAAAIIWHPKVASGV